MVKWPTDTSDAIRLADWLELSALEAADANASINDLLSPLRIGGGNISAELAQQSVFLEVEKRAAAANEAYPFELSRGVLSVKPGINDFSAYLFCLALSFFGWKQKRNARINPWYLFEDLACIAAKQYVSGDVLCFGARAQAKRRKFQESVEDLCVKLGEGRGFRPQPSLDRKDDSVDLVVWKHFVDQRTSKFVMFGQCAAGDNWDAKLNDLRPDVFWDQWMAESAVSTAMRSFYVPHRIPEERWDYVARRAGLVFDRCRISHLAHQDLASVKANQDFYQWYLDAVATNAVTA